MRCRRAQRLLKTNRPRRRRRYGAIAPLSLHLEIHYEVLHEGLDFIFIYLALDQRQCATGGKESGYAAGSAGDAARGASGGDVEAGAEVSAAAGPGGADAGECGDDVSDRVLAQFDDCKGEIGGAAGGGVDHDAGFEDSARSGDGVDQFVSRRAAAGGDWSAPRGVSLGFAGAD